MITGIILAAAIALNGVTGEGLKSRAFFDANNVKVGDPIVLTLDFFGEAEFTDLHPPVLSKAVDRKVWKVDDVSAKTETVEGARRLTYRVRPLKEGLFYFPALEFAYQAKDGEERIVKANAIPVHIKRGAQVVVAEMDAFEADSANADKLELITEVAGTLNDDTAFLWRKALSKPSVEAFRDFDFPEARLNEATMLLKSGSWADALNIYYSLEWHIGQTPAIEQGICAALALKYESDRVDLPMWRQVLRPLLKFDWRGRAGIVVGVMLTLWLLFKGLGLLIRALACLALMFAFASSASAQGLFNFPSFSFNGMGMEHEAIEVKATLSAPEKSYRIGENFTLELALEYPATASVGQIQLTPTETFGLYQSGMVTNLPPGKSENPSNKVSRLAIPLRYDVPFKGSLGFVINGMVSGRIERNSGNSHFVSSFHNSFQTATPKVKVEVMPLENAPADFSGIISEGLAMKEVKDLSSVETNDVVTITYTIKAKGFVPSDFTPPDVAYEWRRDARHTMAEFKRYFIAKGEKSTPVFKVVYYDTKEKTFKTKTCGASKLTYKRSEP